MAPAANPPRSRCGRAHAPRSQLMLLVLVCATLLAPADVAAAAGNGLSVSNQIRSGVEGGPPNNQLETDVSWTDPGSRNGWRVGLVPGYGGANISHWYEIDGGEAGPTQSSLNTTRAGGPLHDYTQGPTGTYAGSASEPFASSELQPTGSAFRRGYRALTPISGVDPNGLVHDITTYVYPGDPGFVVQRFDILNPADSPVVLSATHSVEYDYISSLQETDQTWTPSNAFAGTLGGAVATWPVAPTPGQPDYYFVTPAPGSPTRLGLLAVPGSSGADLGLANGTFNYLLNSSRFKITWYGDRASIPAGARLTMYVLQALRRDLSAEDATSMAADYLHPDRPATAGGSFDGFSRDEGAYLFTSEGGHQLDLRPGITDTARSRWLSIYRIRHWAGRRPPRVFLGRRPLVEGVDYVTMVDQARHEAYVKLMRPLVGSRPTSAQLPVDTIKIRDCRCADGIL